jgi:small-conductance mechanosensitive channel
VPFNFTPDGETPLDILLFLLLLVTLVLAFIAIVLAAGDLQAARGQNIKRNPNFTASLQGITGVALLAIVLIALLGLVGTRLLDRAVTGAAIFYSIICTIVLISTIIVANLYYRQRIRKEAAELIDPCADCPFDESPLREVAQKNRQRRSMDVSTQSADIHVTVTPHDEHTEQK